MADFFGMNKSAVEDLVSQQELYELYAKVAKEIEDGLLDKGVWTKSFADAAGNEAKAKAVYIELMVERLILAKKAQSELEIATSQIKAQNEVDRVRTEKLAAQNKKKALNPTSKKDRPISKKTYALIWAGIFLLFLPVGGALQYWLPEMFRPINTLNLAAVVVVTVLCSGFLTGIVSAIFGWDEF